VAISDDNLFFVVGKVSDFFVDFLNVFLGFLVEVLSRVEFVAESSSDLSLELMVFLFEVLSTGVASGISFLALFGDDFLNVFSLLSHEFTGFLDSFLGPHVAGGAIDGAVGLTEVIERLTTVFVVNGVHGTALSNILFFVLGVEHVLGTFFEFLNFTA